LLALESSIDTARDRRESQEAPQLLPSNPGRRDRRRGAQVSLTVLGFREVRVSFAKCTTAEVMEVALVENL
jgi:hypothetical protein